MQKLYYSISEISKLIDEEQHILRYWEKEFAALKPRKNRAGNRVYSERDLQIIKSIKILIRDEKLSLKGAKEQLDKLLSDDTNDNLFSRMETANKTIDHHQTKIEKTAPVFTKSNEEIDEIINILKSVLKTLKKA